MSRSSLGRGITWLVGCLACTSLAAAELRFEAEEYSTPQDAWVENKDLPDKWNLWSTDQDAEKKWSGGVVLRGPIAREDREKPEEGAPPLHTVLTGIPAGVYDVEVKIGRTVGLSLDGREWRPFRGGLVARGVKIENGTFELWIDDRYAHPEPGSCYYDYIVLREVLPPEKGVANPGFERVEGDGAAGWTWWSRDNQGSAVSVTDPYHSGQRAVHITYDGERDWAYSTGARLAVKPGDEFVVSGWLKGNDSSRVTLAVVAYGEGKLVRWDIGSTGTSGTHDWKQLRGEALVPEGADEVYVRLVGRGATDVYVDDVSLEPGRIPIPPKPLVVGSAKVRVEERLDRGVVALPTPEGTYVGWRLLKDDPDDIAFNVYRQIGDRRPVKVNAEPIRQTTDLLDHAAPEGAQSVYSVRAVIGGREADETGSATATGVTDAAPYVSLKLNGDYTFQKLGLVDLNGDGRLDYVIKQPNANIDPWVKYWKPSPETYKIEAYLQDGTFLWRHDLGWAIERGIWYSPWIAFDLDGDGKAEVAAKVGQEDPDPRDEDGKVTSGPEYLVVWDGMTGRERARVPWPDREGFEHYNYASRNQLAVAYLDGKTPCLIALRGTYTLMKAEAYELVGDTLRPLWQYRSDEYGGRWRGQGAHYTHAIDVDGDGRDEVILGSAVIDDTGAPLWSTGMGHNDAGYIGDIDPHRPGLEVFYVMETAQRRNGLCLVDAATGKVIWGLDEPTSHVHGNGMCTDIDPTQPGLEGYGCNSKDHKMDGDPWLWSSDGRVLSRGPNYGFGVWSAYWDADLQREIFRGPIEDYGGGRHAARIEGSRVMIADVLGDWREEIITTVPGELRIYSTTIPATDRRVCLFQDPIYRMDVAMLTMGYPQVPMTSYCLEARWPGLNLTAVEGDGGEPACRVVVSAPLDQPVKGTLKLAAEGAEIEPSELHIDVAPGQRQIAVVAVRAADGEAAATRVRAELIGGAIPLRGEVTMRLPSRPLANVPLAQAESFVAQAGGEVHIREDKVGVVENAISHWDDAGHWLEWRIEAPRDGSYRLVVRYSTPLTARRKVLVDGRDIGVQAYAASGGFGGNPADWCHATVSDAEGRPLILRLAAGEHTVRMENIDGQGLNLDYLALVPVS